MTTQMMLWLRTPMAFNGGDCRVCAANVLSMDENGNAVIQRPETDITVSVAHCATTESGNVDDLVGLVSDIGFIDFR